THGSDVRVRTSEVLAKETLALKNGGLVKSSTETKAGAARNSNESREELRAAREQARTMLAKADTADGHRLLGELNERLGDPLEAVREYERSALMDPSEQNYFEWGTELLLHRADEPAVEVFTKGSHAHPDSARMLAGLGAALYAEGKTEEAARRLCEANLQLGIFRTERGNVEQAIRDYTKAIEVSPQLSEAHYRLGSAYRRIGEESKAEREFREYERIEKAEAEAIESQQRELRQFLIILKDQPAAATPHR